MPSVGESESYGPDAITEIEGKRREREKGRDAPAWPVHCFYLQIPSNWSIPLSLSAARGAAGAADWTLDGRVGGGGGGGGGTVKMCGKQMFFAAARARARARPVRRL